MPNHIMFDRPVDVFLRQPICPECVHEIFPSGEPYGKGILKKQFKCPQCERTYEVNQTEWPTLVSKRKAQASIPSVKELENSHAGETIAILGAGPSLPEDIKKLSGTELTIGINDHADKLATLDYICFCDHPIRNKYVSDFQERYIGKRVSFVNGYSDWEVDVPYFWHGKTFGFAVWFAEWIGAAKIILCGFDCYTTGAHHFYEVERETESLNKMMFEDLTAWRNVKQSARHPGRIRAASGPLVDYFGVVK